MNLVVGFLVGGPFKVRGNRNGVGRPDVVANVLKQGGTSGELRQQ